MILVFDSYAWIEFFMGTEVGEKVKELLSSVDIIYTPSPVLLEIVNKYFREGFSKENIEKRLNAIIQLSSIITINKPILLKLGEARKNTQ